MPKKVYNGDMKKRWRVPQEPDIEKMVKRTKDWSGEKTDSKTILFLIRYGYNKLFK